MLARENHLSPSEPENDISQPFNSNSNGSVAVMVTGPFGLSGGTMAGTISLRYPLTGQKYEIRFTGKAFKGAPAYAGEYSEHTWPDTAISGYRDSASVRRFEEAIAQTITADLESTQRMKDGLILLYRLRQRDLQWRQSKVYHLWLAWQKVKTFIRKTWEGR